MKKTLYILGLLAFCACTNEPAGTSTDNTTAVTPSASQGPIRTPDDWHATDSLFRVMGGVQGKLIADLFVGDGYYTMKLLEAGARVIAIDDDPRNIEALEAKKKEMNIGDDRLIIRTAISGTPALSASEVDMALCTRAYLGIPDRMNYFAKVRPCIKFPNQLFIVDFLPEQTPVGTLMELRVPSEQVMDEMDPCGFTDVGAYTKKIPYRYIVQAMMFVEGPDAPVLPAGPGSGQQ